MNMLPGDIAKASLKRKGWSYRRAATFLGVTLTHFFKVVDGQRESEELVSRIRDLPKSPVKYQASGFGFRASRAAKVAKAAKERRAA